MESVTRNQKIQFNVIDVDQEEIETQKLLQKLDLRLGTSNRHLNKFIVSTKNGTLQQVIDQKAAQKRKKVLYQEGYDENGKSLSPPQSHTGEDRSYTPQARKEKFSSPLIKIENQYPVKQGSFPKYKVKYIGVKTSPIRVKSSRRNSVSQASSKGGSPAQSIRSRSRRLSFMPVRHQIAQGMKKMMENAQLKQASDAIYRKYEAKYAALMKANFESNKKLSRAALHEAAIWAKNYGEDVLKIVNKERKEFIQQFVAFRNKTLEQILDYEAMKERTKQLELSYAKSIPVWEAEYQLEYKQHPLGLYDCLVPKMKDQKTICLDKQMHNYMIVKNYEAELKLKDKELFLQKINLPKITFENNKLKQQIKELNNQLSFVDTWIELEFEGKNFKEIANGYKQTKKTLKQTIDKFTKEVEDLREQNRQLANDLQQKTEMIKTLNRRTVFPLKLEVKILQNIIERHENTIEKLSNEKRMIASILRIPRLCDKYHEAIKRKVLQENLQIIQSEANDFISNLIDQKENESQFYDEVNRKFGHIKRRVSSQTRQHLSSSKLLLASMENFENLNKQQKNSGRNNLHRSQLVQQKQQNFQIPNSLFRNQQTNKTEYSLEDSEKNQVSENKNARVWTRPLEPKSGKKSAKAKRIKFKKAVSQIDIAPLPTFMSKNGSEIISKNPVVEIRESLSESSLTSKRKKDSESKQADNLENLRRIARINRASQNNKISYLSLGNSSQTAKTFKLTKQKKNIKSSFAYLDPRVSNVPPAYDSSTKLLQLPQSSSSRTSQGNKDGMAKTQLTEYLSPFKDKEIDQLQKSISQGTFSVISEPPKATLTNNNVQSKDETLIDVSSTVAFQVV